VLLRSRVPSRPAGRDPGRDGTGFFKGIFEKTRPTKAVSKFFLKADYEVFFSKINKIWVEMNRYYLGGGYIPKKEKTSLID